MKEMINAGEVSGSVYDTITEFMSNPAVRNIPGFREFEKCMSKVITGHEKETPLSPVEVTQIDDDIAEYRCPRCGWRNTVVKDFHTNKFHYCRSCGGKVKNN